MANTHSLDLESSSSQYAYITDENQTGLDVTGDISIEVWIKPESIGINSAIISKFRGVDGKRSYTLTPKSTNKIEFVYSSNGTAVTVCSTDDAILTSANVWYHIAITADVSEKDVKFYVNGTPVNCTLTANSATSIYNSAMPFVIGAQGESGAYGGYFDGLIDEVRVWNDVRTSTEIADNYKKELVGNEAGLVGYWKFNNNAEDTTANNNDLTLSGSPSYSTDVPTWPIAYSLVCALGTFTLTGINATLKYARKLAMAVGSFTLTGIDVAFKIGKGLVAEVGNFVLTGKDATLKSARTMIASVGEFTLTGIDITFKKIITLVASVGRFILTGINVRLRSTAWTNDTKPTSSWTNDDK